jgi:hypothetical protein
MKAALFLIAGVVAILIGGLLWAEPMSYGVLTNPPDQTFADARGWPIPWAFVLRPGFETNQVLATFIPEITSLSQPRIGSVYVLRLGIDFMFWLAVLSAILLAFRAIVLRSHRGHRSGRSFSAES